MNTIRQYFSDLVEGVGSGWNRFWFTPRDNYPLCVLRVIVGLAALYFVFSYSGDLVRWFGAGGMLPVSTILELDQSNSAPGAWSYRLSYLNYLRSPAELWVAHAAALVVLAMFTAGVFTRITSIASLVIVLSYIHRAPILISQFEPVLVMGLFYLCLAPAGARLSIDACLLRRKSDPPALRESWISGVVTRLFQLHLAGIYMMMGVTMLYGEAWWTGEGIWWLVARPESRLIDFTWLAGAPYLAHAWSHCIVLYSLLFGVLIWQPLARPLLLGLGVLHWLLLALATGLVPFCLLMLLLNAAYVSPAMLRLWLRDPDCAGEGTRQADQNAAAKDPTPAHA